MIEDLRQTILYSKEKAECRGIIRYQKMRIRQCKDSPINGDKINKLKNIHSINNDNSEGLEHAKIKLQEARELWQEIKEKGTELCGNELLDLYPKDLTDELLANKH